jgi:hypothetical protein
MGLDSGISAIAAFYGGGCAVQNGAAKCWGLIWSGSAYSRVPAPVAGLENGVTKLAGSISNGTVGVDLASVCATQNGFERFVADAGGRWRTWFGCGERCYGWVDVVCCVGGWCCEVLGFESVWAVGEWFDGG